MQQTRKHGRSSYLSDGIGGDSQSLIEREPLRSKDGGFSLIIIDVQKPELPPRMQEEILLVLVVEKQEK